MRVQMQTVVCLLAGVLPAVAVSAPPTAPAVVKVKVGELARFSVTPFKDKDAVKEVGWRSGALDDQLFVDELKTTKAGNTRLLLQGKVPGTYLVVLWTAGETESAVVQVEVSGVGPTPPGPTPDPAPIPAAGFRCLIVYETADLAKLPAAQVAVLTSAEVRGYLNEKCTVGADGKTKEWRVWDKDVDVTNESPLWQAVLKRERKSVPWIVISDGKAGYEGPLPATVADTIALLKKYGG